MIATLEQHLLANSGADSMTVYSGSKFVQLLGAHWWRRQLQGSCHVVAVSPGLIPQTNLSRHVNIGMSMSMPDAKTVPEGECLKLRLAHSFQLYGLESPRLKQRDDQVHKVFCVLSRGTTSPRIRIRSSSRRGVNGGPRKPSKCLWTRSSRINGVSVKQISRARKESLPEG